MKKILVIIIVIAVLGAGYWYATANGWFTRTQSDNLPTKEEWERIEAVEDASAQIAPDATPGTQVRPKGSTPPAPQQPVAPPTETATTSTDERS